MEQSVSLERRRGLDGFQLKLMALVIMTIDHIHYFGSALTDMPLILTLIGRIAAPVFVFFVAEGFAHTHSRWKYLLRLYIGGVLMYIINTIVNIYFPLPGRDDCDERHFYDYGGYRHLPLVDREHAQGPARTQVRPRGAVHTGDGSASAFHCAGADAFAGVAAGSATGNHFRTQSDLVRGQHTDCDDRHRLLLLPE